MEIINFNNQDYASILNKIAWNYLFVDDKFGEDSINGISNLNSNLVKWLRPHEICANYYLQPKFIVNGIEPNDLDQGQLGNWYSIKFNLYRILLLKSDKKFPLLLCVFLYFSIRS